MGAVVKDLIPSLVKNGVFGDFKFVDLKSNDQTETGPQFASSLLFVNLVVGDSSGEKVLPLVVKLTFSDPVERESRRGDVLFYNEVTMYKDILPALGYDGNQLPKMYYGMATKGLNPEDDIIILENLKNKGFVPSKPKIFLDFEHISLAIIKIAEFHSLSYKLKNENREKFDQLKNMLKEIKYSEDFEKDFDFFRGGALKRGIEAALKKEISTDQSVLKKFLNLVETASVMLKSIIDPEEPFSVICHGDFCNNNILFKYLDTNEPVDCAIFDFQLSLYSSPAVDLTFFLYMNTTSEVREKYWSEILKLYWDTVRKNVPTNIPSFEEFLEHFEKRAIYGYLISGWFLPIMLHDDFKEDKEMTFEDKADFFRNAGGEKAEKIVCDQVLHLLNMNYLQKFMDFYDKKKIIKS